MFSKIKYIHFSLINWEKFTHLYIANMKESDCKLDHFVLLQKIENIPPPPTNWTAFEQETHRNVDTENGTCYSVSLTLQQKIWSLILQIYQQSLEN